MPHHDVTRREFVSGVSAAVPAVLGGQPVRTAKFPRWPAFREADEKAALPVLRSGGLVAD